MHMNRQKRLLRTALCSLIVLLFIGCSIRLISNYDELTDHGVTDFQKRIDTYLLQKQVSNPPTYSDSFYVTTFANLQALETRAMSVPKNSETIKQLTDLDRQIHDLKSIDSTGDHNPHYFQHAQVAIDGVCKEILTLELAKKRGE